ncbi:MAG: hypothetical protein AAF363_21650 [Bacteroidota bacterium]
MSHSITAHQDGTRIASIDFTASDRTIASFLYGSLNAQEYDCGVSGNGEAKSFALADIEKAISAVNYYRKEPLELIRNNEKDQLQENLLGHLVQSLGDVETDKPEREVSEGTKQRSAAYVLRFFKAILNMAKDEEILIHFG